MAEYRAIQEAEWAEAMALWTSVFVQPEWLFQTLHESTKGRKPEHTRVAIQDGRIVSAVDVFLRQIRGIDGKPQLVGCIGSVATYEPARRQGHSGQLLQHAIEVMKAEGCIWSFLFTGVHQHYRRFGWEIVPMRQLRGELTASPAKVDPKWVVERFDPMSEDDLFPEMAKIYDDFNRSRPLTNVRTWETWDIPIRVRMEQHGRSAFVARAEPRGHVLAYLIEDSSPHGNYLHELCYATGAKGAIPALLECFRQEAVERGALQWTIQLASEKPIVAGLELVFENLSSHEATHAMARPIAEGLTETELNRLFADPRGVWWALDNF